MLSGIAWAARRLGLRRRLGRRNASGLDLLPCKDSRGIDEAELVPKRIAAIEASLSPGLRLDRARDGSLCLMAHSLEVLLKIIDGEVDMVLIWSCVPSITIGTRIETSENTLATTKVVPSRGNPLPWFAEHSGVVSRRLIDVGDRYNNAKESSRRHIAKVLDLRSPCKTVL
jgi:hypothetical protein